MSVLQSQRELLSQIIRSTTWSILILDNHSLSLVNTLFRLIDLRRLNITSIHLISDKRNPIDAHAVYFVNSAYYERIIQDISDNLYRSISLNFSDSISREKLEILAKKLSSFGKANIISSVYDRFMLYCALDNNSFLFTTDNSRNHINSLFSFFLNNNLEPFSISSLPILEKYNKNNISMKKKSLLVTFNRKEDIFAPLLFNWYYIGLINDLLEINKNIIKYKSNDEKDEIFNLMWDDDFYHQNQYELLQTVSDRIEKEHKEYKIKVSDKNRNIPTLTKRNEIIRGHMGIVLSIIDRINELGYDEYFEVVDTMKKDELILLTEKGTLEMKKRVLALMIKEGINEKEVDEFMKRSKIDKKFVLSVVKCINGKKEFENQEITSNYSYSNILNSTLKRVKQSISKYTGNNKIKCKLSINLMEILKALKNDGLEVLNKKKKKEIIYIGDINKVVVIVENGGCYREMYEIKELMREYDIDIVYGYDSLVNGNDMINIIEECQ